MRCQGWNRTNSQKNFIEKFVRKIFKFLAITILHGMGYEDGGAVEADGAPLRFEGIHELLRQHAHARKAAFIQCEKVVR